MHLSSKILSSKRRELFFRDLIKSLHSLLQFARSTNLDRSAPWFNQSYLFWTFGELGRTNMPRIDLKDYIKLKATWSPMDSLPMPFSGSFSNITKENKATARVQRNRVEYRALFGCWKKSRRWGRAGMEGEEGDSGGGRRRGWREYRRRIRVTNFLALGGERGRGTRQSKRRTTLDFADKTRRRLKRKSPNANGREMC